MNAALRRIVTVVTLLAALLGANAAAREGEVDSKKVLVVIPVNSTQPDQRVYRQIDKVVGELRKMSPGKTITLECSYKGFSNREKDVATAFQIAARIEKYLRVNHKLNIDLWIAVRLGEGQSRFTPALTIAAM
ncbi:MAG: hypothetical protein WCP10_02125 [Desulfuromonadales bacterium]